MHQNNVERCYCYQQVPYYPSFPYWLPDGPPVILAQVTPHIGKVGRGNVRTPSSSEFVHDLVKAINGEYSAIDCYASLAAQAPSAEEKNQILEIRQDEVRHFQQFLSIYQTLTGLQHVPQIVEPCPSNYLEGIRAAFKDEQETVDFYLDISDRAQDAHIKEKFRRAAADEQNHAVWFLYFYNLHR